MTHSQRTLCFSVRLESVVSISDKAYKIRSYDGSEDILPKSCFFGQDYEVKKSDAYWIAAWILPKKKIQYSNKKQSWFSAGGKKLPTITTHTPSTVAPLNNNIIKTLER